MPSNQTINYQLNQWAKDDRVRMEDFNADNAKIDAALAGKADAAALAALQTVVNGKGNCQVVMGSYTGNGKYGSSNPRSLSFSKKPLFILVCGYSLGIMGRDCGNGYILQSGGSGEFTTTWSGTSVSWYKSSGSSGYSQLNESGQHYYYFAFLEA